MNRELRPFATLLAFVFCFTVVAQAQSNDTNKKESAAKTYAVLIQGAQQPVIINAQSIHTNLKDKTVYFSDRQNEIVVTFSLNTPVEVADVTSAPHKPFDQQEVITLFGDPGCHGGGCPDASEPCKSCGDDGWCYCSSCCVAAAERTADSKTRQEQAKEKMRALAKKLGLSTEHTN
jgi:type II secretory pathway pseudopilin PulG